MPYTYYKYKDWKFEVDVPLNRQVYAGITDSGADSCPCDDCKNYVACRDQVFPAAIKELFDALGIDFRKEVEITHYQTLENGLHQIGGWFHFKGRIVSGKDYRKPSSDGNGYTLDLTAVTDNFDLGFAPGSALSFFKEKDNLVQVEFMTSIPWVIGK